MRVLLFPKRTGKGTESMDIKEVYARREENDARASEQLAAAMSAGGFTDESRAEYNATLGAVKSDSELIEAERMRRDTALATTPPSPTHSGPNGRTDGWSADDGGEISRAAMEAANQPRFAHMGDFLQAVAMAETPGAALDPRLVPMGAAAGAGTAIGADGGFLVQTDFQTEIERRMHDVGELNRRISFREIGETSDGIIVPAVDERSRVDGSRFGGIQGYWIGQGDAPTPSKPGFATLELKLRKAAALGYVTDEMLKDSVATGSFMVDAFAEELSFMTEAAIYRGDGAQEPLGLLNGAALVTVAKETGQAGATFDRKNINNMWARLWNRSRRSAVWLINQDGLPELEEMSDDNGRLLYMPPGGLSANPYGTLKGRDVIPLEYTSTVGVLGDIMLVDLSQYYAIQKGGPQAASSMHVRFLTDEMAFRVIYRVDGQPRWISALTPYQGTNTVSPYITLAARE